MAWSGWFNLGRPAAGFTGRPATISRNNSVTNIYVQGLDTALWQRSWFDNQWHDWIRHNDGGVLASQPAVGSMGPDHEHVFARGTDGNVWQKYWTRASGWSGWFNLGGPTGSFIGGPATISRKNSVANIYVRGADSALWQRQRRPFFDNQWRDWIRHNDGGVLASEPAVGSMGPDHEHVFASGTDRNVWQKIWTFEVQPSEEVWIGVKECVYRWIAGYHQNGTHVTVRIQLYPDGGITDATMDALRTTWRNGILSTWSNRFDCRAANGGRQPIAFDVQWVVSNPHHVVRVRQGPARANMGLWDTDTSGEVAAHEFGHMLGHPDEYVDAACPGRNPVSTGTVMDDNTEAVARLYNRITGFHGTGHSPASDALEPPKTAAKDAMTLKMIDNLTPAVRSAILERLRSMADTTTAPERAQDTEITFEVTGGAPGERYVYRLGIRGDGAAERHVLDETQAGVSGETARHVDRELASRVFEAAAEAGLLDDAAPDLPQQVSSLLPDSMVAIITVREGDSVRRVALPADEPATAADVLPGEPADVPMETPIQLPAESVTALQPVLNALRAVEEAL